MATRASRIALAGSNISSTGEVDADLLDNTDSAAFLSLDGDGRLGIGTASAERALHIEGSGFAASTINLVRTDTGANNDPGLQFKSAAGANDSRGMGGIWFKNSLDGNAYALIRARTDDATGTSGRLDFMTSTSTVSNSTTPSLTIKSTGNVGIGTASPDTLLHLHSSVGDTILTLEADSDDDVEHDNPQIHFLTDGGLRTAAITGGNATNEGSGHNHNALNLQSQTIRFLNSSSQDFDLASESMRIISTGNVGIGTESPRNLLEISQDVTTQYTTSANLSNATNDPINLLRLTNSNTSITTPEVNLLFSAGGSGSGQHSIGVRRSGTNTGDMIFRRRSGSSGSAETMRIDNSGYVHMPAQPVALYYNPVDSTPSEGDIIQFTSKAGLTRGITDSNSKSRFTVPADGIYGVSFTLAGSVTTPSAGDGLRILIRRSGVTYTNVDAYNIETAGTEVGMEWSFKEMMLVNLTAGQYIELQWNNVGGTVFTVKYGNINIWKVA